MSTNMHFTGQTAIITGGSTGLGKAIAEELGKSGAQVVIASRNEKNLSSAKEDLKSKGIEATTIQTDVRHPEQVEKMVAQTMERFGRIDMLINNAAGNFAVPSEELTVNGWNAVVGIVLNGTWYCTSAVAKVMLEQKKGTILNIIATYAWAGAPGVVHSAAAKAGVLAMTRTLAVEWGHRGIRVNAFAPGPMITEAASKNLLFDNAEAKQKVIDRIPARRFAELDEMAKIAGFLLSDQAAYINGDVLTADGGACLGRGFMDLMENSQSLRANK
ncbi:MAG: 2,4-dienoyl-CoA reductase [Candidatus Obscuribacterales bacterium]|nr:2,4-dienoyl-CoA reductase [Candidatus Obscuribacterales bacterium]